MGGGVGVGVGAVLGFGGVTFELVLALVRGGWGMLFEEVAAAGVAGLTLLVVPAFGAVSGGGEGLLSSGVVDVGSSGTGADALAGAVGTLLVLDAAVASAVVCAAKITNALATMAMSAPNAKMASTKNHTPLDFLFRSGSTLRANCAGAVGIAGGGAESYMGVCGGAVPAGTVAPNAEGGAPGMGAMMSASRSSIIGIAMA